jgi:hypothetical protein
LARLTAAWDRFWFRPADPTPLGVIRIVAGLLVVYLYLAYSFDLQEFFGKHSWYDQQLAEQTRRELPYLPPATSWEDDGSVPITTDTKPKGIAMPQDPEGRRAVVTFFSHLPDRPQDRMMGLRYLDPLHLPNDPIESTRLLSFARKMFDADEGPEKRLDALVNNPADPVRAERIVPPSVRQSSPERRQEMHDALLDLLALVATDPKKPLAAEDRGRDQVLDYLINQTSTDRQRMLRYLENLPQDRAERAELLDYVRRWGVDPRLLIAKGQPVWSVWFHVQDPTAMAWIHAGVIAVMLLFTVGFCTRVTAVLTWLGAVSYINRSQAVLFGMDTMMNILLVYLMIAPAGAALSVDRLIARYRAARAAQRSAQATGSAPDYALAGPAPRVSANFTIRLLQVHFCFIYMASGLSKLKGNMWWEHSAPWYTIANPEFSPINWRIYEEVLRWLVYYRPVYHVAMTGLTVFTIAMEIGLPFLIWTKRLRPYMVLGAVLLHTGIATFMGLTGFSLFMLTLLLAYFPASTFKERLAAASAALARLSLRGDSRVPRQARELALARALDVSDQIEVTDLAAGKGKGAPAPADAPPLELTAGDGPPHTGFGVFAGLVKSLRLLRPLGWLLWVPGVAALGRSYAPDAAAEPGVQRPRDRTGPTAPTAAS